MTSKELFLIRVITLEKEVIMASLNLMYPDDTFPNDLRSFVAKATKFPALMQSIRLQPHSSLQRCRRRFSGTKVKLLCRDYAKRVLTIHQEADEICRLNISLALCVYTEQWPKK